MGILESIMASNNHPSQHFRRRWTVNARTRRVTHDSGLAIALRPGPRRAEWLLELAEPLPVGYPLDLRGFPRLMFEALRVWQESALTTASFIGAPVRLPAAVLPDTLKDQTLDVRCALGQQWFDVLDELYPEGVPDSFEGYSVPDSDKGGA